MEQTLVVLKPDAVQRRLVGRIISRLEAKGLKIVAMKMLSVSADLAERMYEPHRDQDFYAPLVEFITASPVVAMVAEGLNAVAVTRLLMGPTFGPDAPAGTIRGDFGMSRRYNLIHGSDSPAEAAREIPLFFAPDELTAYELRDEAWSYAASAGEMTT